MNSQVTLRQLRAFHAVAHHESFTAAALELGLTQSAVSQCVRGLEDALGAALLARSTRRVELTEAGLRMRKPLEDLLLQLDQLLDQASQNVEGTVRIACTPSLGATLLPHRLAGVEKRHPDMAVRLQEASNRQALSLVQSGAVDFAMTTDLPAASGVEREVLLRTPYVLICRVEHPFASRDRVPLTALQYERLIALEESLESRTALPTVLKKAGVDVGKIQKVSQAGTAFGLVGEHLGVALLPSLFLPVPDAAILRAVPLEEAPTSAVTLLTRKGEKHGEKVRQIYELVAGKADDALSRNPRPISLLIPYPANGPADGYGRSFARALSQRLQQKVIVKNVSGLGGMLGIHLVTRSEADGYTLGVAGTGATVFSTFMTPEVTFDASRDLTYLGGLVNVPYILVVGEHVPARTVQELLAHTRLRPGQWSIGAAGIGSSRALAELLQREAGIHLNTRPYEGLVPALQDLAKGKLDMLFGEAAGVLAAARIGTARPIFAAQDSRIRWFPDVPSASEVGLPGIVIDGGYSLVAPASLPQDIHQRLSAAIAEVLRTPEIAAEFEVLGGTPDTRTGPYYADYLREERLRWSARVRSP